MRELIITYTRAQAFSNSLSRSEYLRPRREVVDILARWVALSVVRPCGDEADLRAHFRLIYDYGHHLSLCYLGGQSVLEEEEA